MKLLAKYNRVNIPITVGILLISSVAYYFILHYVLVHQLDKDLMIEQQEIFHDIRETGNLPETSNYRDQQITFAPARQVNFTKKFSTEDAFDKDEGESETFRRLDFPVTVKDHLYLATVRKSQQETEDLIRLILGITFSVIAFLLIVLFIANRVLLGKLWRPFNNTLEQLKHFNVSSNNRMAFQATEIDEFAQLNQAALSMTEKVKSDYESLKSFTENASHEIQTPLAIIKTKIELLSQSESLDETQMNALQSLNDAATRLSKLNQSLLLLTKIENSQFVQTEPLNLSAVLLRYAENLDELAKAKNISIDKNIMPDQYVKMNDSLADILISNLMINAIRHNHADGNIKIKLDESALTVSNSGAVPSQPTSTFFDRFRKGSSSGDSLGLGLSIVKKICDRYGFPVSYNYTDGMHIVKIDFHI